MSSSLRTIRLPDDCTKIALCGGPYSNFTAVQEFLARTASYEFRFCLGDLGGFGPFPDRTIELLRASKVECLQGNYDKAVGFGEAECGCGYIDQRDREFAQLSFDYTLRNTGEANRAWLRQLPGQIDLLWRDRRLLLCHGSPFELNEFVWESETPSSKLGAWLSELKVDGICATHSGIPWIREIDQRGFWFNVGVLGRPAHDGTRDVCYGVVDFSAGAERPVPGLRTLAYDPEAVISAMRREALPEEFCQSLTQGIWTTCHSVLPPAEREVKRRGR